MLVDNLINVVECFSIVHNVANSFECPYKLIINGKHFIFNTYHATICLITYLKAWRFETYFTRVWEETYRLADKTGSLALLYYVGKCFKMYSTNIIFTKNLRLINYFCRYFTFECWEINLLKKDLTTTN